MLQDDTPAAPGIAAVGPAEKPLTVYAAEPFNAPEQEADMLKGPLAGPVVDETAPFIYFQRQVSTFGRAANSSSSLGSEATAEGPLCLAESLQPLCWSLLQAFGSALAATHAAQ